MDIFQRMSCTRMLPVIDDNPILPLVYYPVDKSSELPGRRLVTMNAIEAGIVTTGVSLGVLRNFVNSDRFAVRILEKSFGFPVPKPSGDGGIVPKTCILEGWNLNYDLVYVLYSWGWGM